MKKAIYPLLLTTLMLVQFSCKKNVLTDENTNTIENLAAIEKTKLLSRYADEKDSIKNQSIFFDKALKEMLLTARKNQDNRTQKIMDIVQPIVDRVSKLMEGDPAMYKAYQNDIKAITNAKTDDEKKSKTDFVAKTYYPFIKKIWDAAKVDELYYQSKIKSVFPEEERDLIKFDEFLRFQLIVQKPVQPYKPHDNNPPSNPPSNTDKPDNPNPYLCVNSLPTSFFLFDSYKSGIGKGSHEKVLDRMNMGTFHSSILTVTDAQGPWGSLAEAGITLDSFRIPDRFPLDSRHLQSKLDYDWGGSSYAVSVLGTSLATYFNTPYFDDNWDNWPVIRTICSPVTFVMFSNLNETGTYLSPLVAKSAGRVAVFGYGTANLSSASGIAFAGAHAYGETLKWQVCEMP